MNPDPEGPAEDPAGLRLSRRQLLRAGIALPALTLPAAVACRGGHRGSAASGHVLRPGPGASAPDTTTTIVVGPRGPLGSGQPVTFAFAGDVHFPDQWDTEGGAVYTGVPVLADQLRSNPTTLLAPIASVLRSADLAMVNLETAITDRGTPVVGKNFHFRSPAESFVALKSAGVDVVNMANNHALDYGPVGMDDTFSAIESAQLPVVGIGHNATEAYKPYRTVIKGQRIAIFGALDWLEPALVTQWSATDNQPGLAFSIDRTRLLAAVSAVRPDVDTLVTFLHWGIEETTCSSPEQQSLAHALLGVGADIVVGSHAHRVFGAGRVGTALVAYGLGNFVYWREDGESGRSGVLFVEATGRQVDSYSWVPARITRGVAVPELGDAANADLAEWERRRNCSGLVK
jgi:poly-gamma-glutamate synthesis protein (capsule biosynthesis protein)